MSNVFSRLISFNPSLLKKLNHGNVGFNMLYFQSVNNGAHVANVVAKPIAQFAPAFSVATGTWDIGRGITANVGARCSKTFQHKIIAVARNSFVHRKRCVDRLQDITAKGSAEPILKTFNEIGRSFQGNDRSFIASRMMRFVTAVDLAGVRHFSLRYLHQGGEGGTGAIECFVPNGTPIGPGTILILQIGANERGAIVADQGYLNERLQRLSRRRYGRAESGDGGAVSIGGLTENFSDADEQIVWDRRAVDPPPPCGVKQGRGAFVPHPIERGAVLDHLRRRLAQPGDLGVGGVTVLTHVFSVLDFLLHPLQILLLRNDPLPLHLNELSGELVALGSDGVEKIGSIFVKVPLASLTETTRNVCYHACFRVDFRHRRLLAAL